MQRYQGRYRIPSARWRTWDYSQNGAYFITICTAGWEYPFGHVADGHMILSPLGQAAHDCWVAIPEHFPFVVPDAFVVMPNHVHGIIVINKTGDTGGGDETAGGETGGDAMVETQYFASLQTSSTPPPSSASSTPPAANRFGPQSGNIASIIRGYKTGVTMFARRNGIAFAWQARYHDIVIRDARAHAAIRRYIAANPRRWCADRLR
jgi:REP element-mobilizing transposase RayT